MPDAFDQFWAAYPKRHARKDALRAFGQVHAAEHLDEILAALAWQRETEQWQRGVIPHAATYLRGERWTDEPLGKPMTEFERERHDRHQRSLAQQMDFARKKGQAS